MYCYFLPQSSNKIFIVFPQVLSFISSERSIHVGQSYKLRGESNSGCAVLDPLASQPNAMLLCSETATPERDFRDFLRYPIYRFKGQKLHVEYCLETEW